MINQPVVPVKGWQMKEAAGIGSNQFFFLFLYSLVERAKSDHLQGGNSREAARKVYVDGAYFSIRSVPAIGPSVGRRVYAD